MLLLLVCQGELKINRKFGLISIKSENLQNYRSNSLVLIDGNGNYKFDSLVLIDIYDKSALKKFALFLTYPLLDWL